VDALRADVAARTGDVAVLQREAEALRAERDSGLRVIADVEASLSWRLTSPLRALSSATRRR
jgi:hypothetical protein